MSRSTGLRFPHPDIPAVCRTLRGIILPSIAIQELPLHQEYLRRANLEVEEIREEISLCRDMLHNIRRERLDILRRGDHQTEKYLSKLQQTQRLRGHLKEMMDSIEEISQMSCTQAAADCTGYRGIVDWAERMSTTHEHLLATLAQVAFVGAGLTYGSIFSSSRGNVGIMCYAFALFDCGFIVPSVALVLLKWASSQPKDTVFATPHIWTLVLNIFVYGSVAAVAAAISLLNISLYLLNFPLGSHGQQMDSELQFDISPTPPGSVGLGCLLLAGAVIIISGLAHYLPRGWDAVVHDFVGRREKVSGFGLDKYEPA